MRRSERLVPVTRIAERAEQTAAAACAASRRELDGVEAKLAELRGARQEYLDLVNGPVSGGGQRLRDLHRFLAQLDAAIVQLEWQSQRRRTAFERNQAMWAGSRARAQALDQVVSRHRAAEQRTEIAREQREIDDRPWRPVTL